jgi:hypothetical protein
MSKTHKYIGEVLLLVLLLWMFGFGNLIWPQEGITAAGRLFLFVLLVYVVYRVGVATGKDEKEKEMNARREEDDEEDEHDDSTRFKLPL